MAGCCFTQVNSRFERAQSHGRTHNHKQTSKLRHYGFIRNPAPRPSIPPSPNRPHVGSDRAPQRARMVLGWPKICKLAHAFLWECNHKQLKLAQLLGQVGVFLTHRQSPSCRRSSSWRCHRRRRLVLVVAVWTVGVVRVGRVPKPVLHQYLQDHREKHNPEPVLIRQGPSIARGPGLCCPLTQR